jgi:hypothetical protein
MIVTTHLLDGHSKVCDSAIIRHLRTLAAKEDVCHLNQESSSNQEYVLINAPVSERAEIPEQPDWSLDQLGALVGCLTSRH